jgi:hypothetical protein
MANKINPFGKVQSERSALDILQENFGIGIRDFDRGADVWDADSGTWTWQENLSQECVIEFAVNEGKGTGRQVIPASEFRAYVDALEAIILSDYKEPEGADRTAYVPTYTIASQSFKMTSRGEGTERNLVSVRSTSGKGAKPMMVPRDQFPAVVQMLTQIAENLDQYEEQAWSNYQAAVGKN